jgi:uncharacterized protein
LAWGARVIERSHVVFLKTVSIILFSISIASCGNKNLSSVNKVDITTHSTTKSIKIAVLADLHIDSKEDLKNLNQIVTSVIQAKPEIIVLLGDYSSTSSSNKFRSAIMEELTRLNKHPVAAVLGNHDHNSGADQWIRSFKISGIPILSNEVGIFARDRDAICVRGLDDYFSGKTKTTPFPFECAHLTKLTITHDPAAAYFAEEPGLYIAGHTHCGQISFPLLGPIWIPSQVPREASCGLYTHRDKTIYVSSGIGTSLVNIRFGTNSEWDLLDIDELLAR